MEETVTGAKNRAVASYRATGSCAQFGVGVESGVFLLDGKLFDVAVCAVYDGGQHHLGSSHPPQG